MAGILFRSHGETGGTNASQVCVPPETAGGVWARSFLGSIEW